MESGQLIYTNRAFEQDAGQAMAGDIVRGLIELITNSDDAYGDSPGEIHVVVDRPSQKDKATLVSVIDSAKGLSPDQMKQAFSVLGGQLSGFAEGEAVRGLFGRGAKDVAWFGSAHFRSLKDGVFSSMHLDRNGTWNLEHRPAATVDYEETGIPSGQNGLNATVIVEPSIARVPDSPRLADKLGKHIQLRKIVTQRSVSIRQWLDGAHQRTIPVIWEAPTSELVLDESFDIPGYGKCSLVISQLETRIDGPVNEYSSHGIEIHGRRATYMNSIFGMTGYGVGLLHGILQTDQIDDLIRAFDLATNDATKNPTRLVRRDRDGLDQDHPFFRLIEREVIQRVKPILDRLEPSVTEAGSTKLKNDLSRAARLLEDLLREDLDDNEDEGIGGVLPTRRHPLVLIPPTLRARVGEKRTVSVLIEKELGEKADLRVSLSNDVVELLSPPSQPVKHPDFPNTLISQVRISMKSLGSSRLVVSIGDTDPVTATSEIVVHNDPAIIETAPSDLEWKNSSMSVTVGKERTVSLRAPADSSYNGELSVLLSIVGDGVELLDTSVTLKLCPLGWLVGRVRVRGLNVSTPAILTAKTTTHQADGRIRATLPSALTGLSFDIQVVPLDQGATRGVIEISDSGLVLKVFAKHPGLLPYFGTVRPDGSFPGEQTPEARAALAEVAASVIADYMCRRDRERDPSAYADLDMVQSQRANFVSRYLRRLVEGLRVH